MVARDPAITPDEFGAFAIARYLNGQDLLISMRDMPHYALVPAAIISPLTALGLSTVATYKLALVLLSATSVAAASLLRRSVQLVLPGADLAAALAFAVVLLFPATFVTGSFVWAEPSVLLWWGLLMWGAARLAVAPSRGAIAATSVVAALAPFVHGRLSAVPVIWIVALVTRWFAQRRGRGTGTRDGTPPDAPKVSSATLVAATALTAAVTAAAWAVDRQVAAVIWNEGAAQPAGSGGTAVTTAAWWRGLGAAALGQSWTVLASTAGLALVGVVCLVQLARRPDRRGVRGFALLAAAMLASNVALSLVVGANGMSVLYGGPASGLGGMRWDQLIYGRYVDAAGLVLAVFGIAWCTEPAARRAARRSLAAAALLVLFGAGGLWVLHHGRELAGSLGITVAGLVPVGWEDRGLALGIRSLWPLLIIAALLAVTRRSPDSLSVNSARGASRYRRDVALVLLAWLLVGVLGATFTTLERHAQRSQPDLISTIGPAPAHGTVATLADDVETLPLWRLGIYAQQREFAAVGWSIRVDARSSRQLAAAASTSDEQQPALLILRDGARPGTDWQQVAEFGDATVWRR